MIISWYRALLCRHHLGPCRCRIELAQPWQDVLGEQGDGGDRVGVVEEAALPEHQKVAEAADAVVERLDLVVYVVGRTGKAGAALNQLLDRRAPLVDRIALAVADEARPQLP